MKKDLDLIIIGSGAAGLSCALTAKALGLHVVVLEKTSWVGGSTAYSAGATWIPNNPHQMEAGHGEAGEEAFEYLMHESGRLASEAHIRAFLENGPKMVRFMEENTELRFSVRAVAPDYHPDAPGAALGFRVLDPLEFDGRCLGKNLKLVRPPLSQLMLVGHIPVGRPDIPHLFRIGRSLQSTLHVGKMMLRHVRDVCLHGTSTKLVMGRAMIGRLLKSALDAGIEIRTQAHVTGLLQEAGRVVGVTVQGSAGAETLKACKGVVLAGGGAPHGREMEEILRPHASETGHWSMSPRENTGDGARLALSVGGKIGSANLEPLFYTPVSLPGGNRGAGERPYPHLFLDRAKPGIIAVDGAGRRFVNEASSYHDFVRGMLGKGHKANSPRSPFWLVADHKALRRYGLGAVPPFPGSMRPHLQSGYLLRENSYEALGAAMTVDGSSLADTINAFNRDARAGTDFTFGKGSTVYNRGLGDPKNQPNPCLAPLDTPPFYAVRIYPGDIGTAAGIVVDPDARVLDCDDRPIPGLFSCGNDTNSIMRGAYPGSGITLGPALTFGFIAANNAASHRAAATI